MNHTTIISEFMEREHVYLDQLWDAFLDEKKNTGKMRALFQTFKEYILWHMKLEDEFLFPWLNNHLGLDAEEGLAALARRDHQGIVKLMELLELASADEDPEKIELESLNLDKILKAHREREREIHYHVCDNFIEPEEWRKILENINALSLNKWPKKD